MSLNQSRSDKSDSQFRKPGGGGGRGSGSGGQYKNFSGGRGRGGPGPTSIPAAPTNARSYNKVNNAQGGQSRANTGTVNVSDPNTASAVPHVENSGYSQSSLHGVSSTPSSGTATKPDDAPPQKTGRPIPRAPSSHSSSKNSDPPLPSNPVKGSGAIQFGSISPGFMNGMQVPPRTSSAPPKLDEQQRDQAQRDTSRALPAIPSHSAPKQDLPKKAVLSGKTVAQQTHTELKVQKPVQVAPASPPTQAQKPSLPVTGISLPTQFHQPSVPVPFGGPNPQIQSQIIPGSSLHPTQQLPLQMGNPSQVPQQVFLPGLQHPLMQTQGIIHQVQNLGYSPQLPHQMGKMGLNISSQFSQQPTGNFGGSHFGSGRKTVKITHPDTHEELRLDGRDGGSSVSRSHYSASQTQPPPTYNAAHPVGYYSSSYSAGPPFFPVPSSLPSTSVPSNAISKGIRISYPVSQGQSNISVVNQPASNSFSAGNSGTSVQGIRDPINPVNVSDVHHIARPVQQSSTSVTVKAADVSSNAVEKLDHSRLANSVEKDSEANLQASNGFENVNQSTSVPISVTVTSTPTALTVVPKTSSRYLVSTQHVDAINKVTVPSSTGSIQKQQDERERLQLVQKADFQVLDDSSETDASKPTEAEITSDLSGPKNSKPEAVCVSSAMDKAAPSDDTAVGIDCENSSDSFEICDRKSVVNKSGKPRLAKQNNMHLQENGTKTFTIIVDSRQQDCLGGLSVGGSLKVLDGTDGAEKNECAEEAGLVGNVVVASQRESDSLKKLTNGDSIQSKSLSCKHDSDFSSNDCAISDSSTSASVTDSFNSKDFDASRSNMPGSEVVPPAHMSQANAVVDNEALDDPRPNSSSGSLSGSSTAAMESSKTKYRGKKKLKEVLQKADAQGTSDDLYNAYKGPEERKAIDATSEVSVGADLKEASTVLKLESTGEEKHEPSKAEFDDWEDAADVSTPKLASSSKDGVRFLHDGEGVATKKYHRDFLLTFSELCTYLPEGFNVPSDTADSLLRANVGVPRSDRDYTRTGRVVDRPGGVAYLDRRSSSGIMDADRWNKQPGPYPSAPDPRLDLAYGSNVMGFAGNRGPIHGVLRNPRAQQGHVQLSGGILSGPMHSLSFQGLQKNSSDADRWQRGSNFHKGLMPVPLNPAPPMHKAERKYEVGKVTDEEQAKQRKLKGILNKLTPQNFEKLFDQVQQLNIDNDITLTGVISQIFDKALMEPTFCEMYATFCARLAQGLPDLIVGNEKITFRRLLLNKCQEEFEKGEREEQEANNADGEGDTRLSEAEREEKRIKVRRRMLGNIRLIGELYKQRMLTERIMHECIKKLLGQGLNPDEENIEALCKLMSTIGELIDHAKAKEHMDAYFHIMRQLSNNMTLSSRVRFMLKDSIDLRKNKWQQRRKVEGPKKIKEVHDDAQQERHGQGGRLSRGPSMNSSMRRGPTLDFGPRGSMLSSPIGAGVSFRGMLPQVSGYGQEVRIDERSIFESRTLSVPLPQRSSPDEPITLGPQGGLARGMAFRGQQSFSSSPQLDNSHSFGDPRRMGGVNGYGNAPDRGVYSSREEQYGRNTSDGFRPSTTRGQSSREELISSSTNRDLRSSDRNEDRSRPITPVVPRTGAALFQNNSSEKMLPEERLHDMSVAAIREYYSAKDEKEVALCLKELNAPSYYPTVVSIWVSDSFERRDLERDLLSKLLVNLTRPGVGTFNQNQLMQGFESVLNNLEDTVTDAPRAPEFLGRIFAKVVMENVLPLSELGQLIQHGGEEPGRLLEVGLAAEVLGSVLERIKSEKGVSTLDEIRASSNLKLVDFRPPDNVKCPKLEMFM